MGVTIGHPTGNPNAFNAALAYFDAKLLRSFCVPWLPSKTITRTLSHIPALRSLAERFERRQFLPLAEAPIIQCRAREICRLLLQSAGLGLAHFDQNNHWLMRAMAREVQRAEVTSVHSYEDCSLMQFIEARRLNKACIYELPTCYFLTWQMIKAELTERYSDWLPGSHVSDARMLERKRQEMEIADIALVPSRFAECSVLQTYPHKKIALIPYGVDLDFWRPELAGKASGPLRFIYAGQVSVRKGVPWLLEAWAKAHLRDAELNIIGAWQLAESKRHCLPPGVSWSPPCPSQKLREHYRASDVFIFPSFADGFGLVMLEAMACGLPVIASESCGGPDIVGQDCGAVVQAGNLDGIVELLRSFDRNRSELSKMSRAARSRAERFSWASYRSSLIKAVSKNRLL